MKIIKIISKNNEGIEAYFYVRPKIDSIFSDEEIIYDTRMKNDYKLDKFSESDIVIDIGGHIGSFAIECALRGANVFVYEPDDENYDLLLRNIEVNNLQNKIVPFKKIISKRRGKSTLYLDSLNPGSHSIYKKYVDHDIKGSIEVDSITLNDITEDLDRVSLIKFDCEGSEYEILIGSDLTKVEKITMELHDKGKNTELIEYLEHNGFEVFWYFGKRMGKLWAYK
jgi:FkbM family methyltransferase